MPSFLSNFSALLNFSAVFFCRLADSAVAENEPENIQTDGSDYHSVKAEKAESEISTDQCYQRMDPEKMSHKTTFRKLPYKVHNCRQYQQTDSA